MDPYNPLWLPIAPFSFRWLAMAHFGSLWLPFTPYGFLWLPLVPYGSHDSHGSQLLQMPPYGSSRPPLTTVGFLGSLWLHLAPVDSCLLLLAPFLPLLAHFILFCLLQSSFDTT